MALFTPRGLKLRLPKAYAFALMARVYPQADAFRVLQLTEEVENLGALAFFIAGITAFSLRFEPALIAVVVFVAVSTFRLVHLFGFFVPPFTLLLPVSRVYSRFSGYGVLFTALLIFGYWATGWQGVVAYIVGRIVCAGVFSLIELAYSKHVYRKTGLAFSASERSFFHAYRLVACRLGVSTDLTVSDAELESAKWEIVFQDLAVKWPVVVNRFTGDNDSWYMNAIR
jgi:hypothetical protein